MSKLLQLLIFSSQSRLSRKIAFWLFCSILAIEGILLIPSVLRREKEFLSQIEEVSAGKVSVVMQLTELDATGTDLLIRFRKLQNQPIELIGKLRHNIVGGALYSIDGEVIGTFGESPELNFDLVGDGTIFWHNGDRYDTAWTPKRLNRNYFLVFRHDVTTVKTELTAFAMRIGGLVLVISTFATIVVWIALNIIAIEPILALRKDLIGAGEAISRDHQPPEFFSASVERQDELGEVIRAFDRMFDQISTAVERQKQAEAALKITLDEVKAYSQALNSELETGRKMQLNFLPHSHHLDQLSQKYDWEIATFFQPARQVAGDFYDVFEIGESYLGIVIADVCDKGVGAALFMALFRSLIRIYSRQTLQDQISIASELDQLIDAGEIDHIHTNNLDQLKALQAISLTNNYVAEYHNELGMFATIFFGVLEPSTGLLTYINGGHEPLFVIDSSGEVKSVLNSTAPAVGMLPHQKFKISQIYLKPGEILFAYTDGVTEARANNGAFFTQERLLSTVKTCAPSAKVLLDTVANKIQKHVEQAEPFDDITLLALRKIN